MSQEEAVEKIGKLYAKDLIPQNPENKEETREFLNQVVSILFDYIKEQNDRKSKILTFHHPEELKQLLDLSIPETPNNLGELLNSCSQVLQYSVKTGHPRFFNQISCGLDLISMAGEWLTATANTNMFTYEISPVFILMEKEVISKMIELIGWEAGQGEGIFCPGGTMANLYALNAARHFFLPNIKKHGMSNKPILCAFTSQDGHYSIKSAAAVCGIGTENCFGIPTDKFGRMIPGALEKKIMDCKHNGFMPFFVCATAGTTVYGAFDNLHEIGDICKRHHLWFHIDAAWGGGLLLSPEHRHKLSGIEYANSVTWNPHKLMGALLQCSICFIKHNNLPLQANQMSADYLFQQDKPYDVSFDTGDKAMQCGRHNDIFKLWLMWRSKGMEGYRTQINRLMDLAAYFTDKIKETDGFEVIIEEIAPKIKAKMMERGTTMIGYQPDKEKPNFFRMIISSQAIMTEDLDFLIDEIIEIGENL